MPPETLLAGRYRLVSLVGSGGMGAVWEAWDERLQRPVAVKQLHLQPGLSPPDAELASARAMREARITARLHHQHAVSVFDVVEHEGRPCIVMQHLPSEPLTAVLRDRGVLAPVEAARIGAQIASALAAAHEVGIVHRDVKPGNVLLGKDGTARVSDFGISHALGDASLTTTGMVSGTPAFLAPEVARGEGSTFASDVFSLGATLYTAVEGSPPFGTDPNPIALLHRAAGGRFPPPQHAGPLTPVLLRMMAAEPGDRPLMGAAAAALRTLAEHGEDTPNVTLPLVPAAKTADFTRVLAAPPSAPAVPAPPDVSSAAPLGPPEVDAAEDSWFWRTGTAPPSPAIPPAGAPLVRPPTAPQRRRRRGPVAALLILVAAVAAVLALLSSRQPTEVGTNQASTGSGSSSRESASQGSGASASASSPPPSRSTPTPSATRSPIPSAISSGSSSASGPAPSSGPTSSGPSSGRPSSGPSASSASTGTPRVSGPVSAGDLERAITSYYALMPGDLAAAWPRMTASYQIHHAGGRQAYERFWSRIARVSATDVTASPPSSAAATITYYYRDGRVVRERTAYGLVEDGDTLKIASSTVLSSS